jgi:hypothetical protein
MDLDTSSEGSGYGDIPTRPMRVKVLYSFDQENKTNCLARFPNTMQIPAVAIDESSQVGVIELQQCLQAIVSASPEIVSSLSTGDYTIYAYDYSEMDTPLVGQGMLSTVLATQSSGTSEKAMITGRVCKNLPAIFSNGVKETLEVKLRFAPVAKPATSVIAKSSSPATSAGFDPNAWNATQQFNRTQQMPGDNYFGQNVNQMGGDGGMALVDEMFGLGSGSSGTASGQHALEGMGIAETPTDLAFSFNPAFSHSAPGSRAGSPMMGSESGIHNDQLRHHSFSASIPNFGDQARPDSRASVRSEVQPSPHRRQASTQSLPPQHLSTQTEIYYNEDGQSRKRAKVTQADWRGRSSFGAKSADLRVTAASAHSVQMHRPVARRPGAPGADLEPPPRAPTPVPQRHPLLRHQRPSQAPGQRSFLRQASTMSVNSDIASDADQLSDALMSSPENQSPDGSAEGTPQDFPSSPPVMGLAQPHPSSPGLPKMPPSRLLDSGYMSGGLHSSNAGPAYDDDDENRSPDAEDLEVAAAYHARTSRGQPFIKSEADETAFDSMYQSDALMSDGNVHVGLEGNQGYVDSDQALFQELFDLEGAVLSQE